MRFKYSITGKSLARFGCGQYNHAQYSALPLATATVAAPHVNQCKHVNVPTCSAINCVNRQFKGCKTTFHLQVHCFYNVVNYLRRFNMLLSNRYSMFSVRIVCLWRRVIMADGWRHVGLQPTVG